MLICKHKADRTHTSECTPSVRHTDCTHRLLPADAGCTRILQNKDKRWRKGAEYEGQENVFHVEEICFLSQCYLPSWVPIHTVPAEFSDKTKPTRTCQRKRRVISKWFQQNIKSIEKVHLKNKTKTLQPFNARLTCGAYSTDAEGRGCGREAELIQYCVGPCWVNHRDFTAGGRTRNNPHRTLIGQGWQNVETWAAWADLCLGGVNHDWVERRH